jgi:hypothetical protein
MSEGVKTRMENAENGTNYKTTKKYLDDMTVEIE